LVRLVWLVWLVRLLWLQGQAFGDLALTAKDSLRTATVVARSQSTLIALDEQSYRAAVEVVRVSSVAGEEASRFKQVSESCILTGITCTVWAFQWSHDIFILSGWMLKGEDRTAEQQEEEARAQRERERRRVQPKLQRLMKQLEAR